jgi:hypothetical protein
METGQKYRGLHIFQLLLMPLILGQTLPSQNVTFLKFIARVPARRLTSFCTVKLFLNRKYLSVILMHFLFSDLPIKAPDNSPDVHIVLIDGVSYQHMLRALP